MSIKDPRINTVVVSGKVVETCQERQGQSDYVNAKVKIEIFNLYWDNQTKKKEYKPITKEVKVLGRDDSKPGSSLAVMRDLKEGDLIVITGSMECDFWTWNDKECSKEFIQATRIQGLERKTPAPSPDRQTQTADEEPPSEDDIPF